MSNGQVAIDAALAHGDPRDVTEAVKDAVAHELSQVDADITVEKTDYFNHSYVPDLVAWWGPNDQDHRAVFLRFDSADPYLASDIERLDTGQPMFFSLANRTAAEADPAVAQALSEHRQVMLTGADALDTLTGTVAGSFESLMTAAIVQAGRGNIDAAAAGKARVDSTHGIQAALLADVSSTRNTVATARTMLADSASRRVERYLQMLWLAGGGELEMYPGTTDETFEIGPEDMGGLVRLVLGSAVVDDVEYWRRLGSMLSLGVLEQLGSVEPTPNLQHLVNWNADRLLVSYAAAEGHEPRLSSTAGTPQWFIADSRLSLDGSEWTLQFTDDGRHFRGHDRDRPLLSVEEVTRRSANYPIEAVGLDDENLVITVEPKDDLGSGGGVAVGKLADAIGSTPRVRTVTVRNGKSTTVEFDRLVARIDSGKTSLPFLAAVAVDLMTVATPEEREVLVSQLGSVGAPTLVDQAPNPSEPNPQAKS